MTLALAIAACVALAGLVTLWALHGAPRWRPAQTLLVALAPLAAFLALVRRAPPREPARALRVAGQYAPLSDTVTIGAGAADVRVAAPPADVGAAGAAGVRLRLWYDHDTRAVELRVDSGAAPVFLAGAPVNARPLAHGSRVTLATRPGLEVEAALPRWPVACLLRAASLCGTRVLTVREGGREERFALRVGAGGVAASALPDRRLFRAPFTLLAARGGVYVAASPTGPVRVDGRAIPAEASASPWERDGGWPELRVGGGAAATTLRVHPDTLANRVELHLAGRSLGERWPLAPDTGRAVARVVAGVEPGPGTLRLLDLAEVAPLGPRARPYAGALEWTGAGAGGEFRWHADGQTRVLRPGAVERLPGTGAAASERGHLVSITTSGPPRDALLAIGAVWVAGALLLALGALGDAAPGGALRVAVVGLVYVLASVRVTLAYRVAAAEPYNTETLPWAALFLAAFPALVLLLERWPFARLAAGERATTAARPAEGGAARGLEAAWARGREAADALGQAARRVDPRRLAWALAVPVTIAAALAAGAGPLRLHWAHVTLGLVVLALGTVGLLLLQRTLVAPDGSAVAVGSPLGMLLPGAERGFGSRQVWRAFTALLVVLGLYVALAWSLRGIPSPLLAVVYAAAVGIAYAFVWARERVRPRVPAPWLVRASAGAALLVGAAAFLAAGAVRPAAGWVVPVAVGAGAGLAAGAALWGALLPLVRPLRGWPYRRIDVLPPLGFALLPAALILVAGWGGLRRVAITLGYALATAALLLVTRVFAAWWHRETSSRVRQRLGGPADRIPVGWVVGPLAAALVVYLAYGVVDPGLLLLLLVAVLFTTTITAATVSRRALALSAVATALLLGAGFPRLIAVDADALRTRPMALSTAQIRYAAVYARDALGQQLALTDEATGREIVRMLQQDWGMRAYAAYGGTTGDGLFSAPHNGAAIAEEVGLTDNAFSVYVLGDHGFAGGAAVVGAYVALALVLLWAAHVAAGRVRTTHLAALLAGLAAYLIVPALYMAAANVQLLPLTGQNFPLLGLRSGADVAFVAWIAALAVVALPAAGASLADGGEAGDVEREEVRRSDLGRLRLTIRVAGAAVVAAAAWVLVGAYRATHAESGTFALDRFAEDLRAMVDRGDLRLVGDSLAVAPHARGKAGLREGDLVRGLVQRSNVAARGGVPARRGCLEATPWFSWSDGRDAGVRVGDVNCRVGTLEPGERWRGTLAARPTPPELLLVGLGVPVVLEARGAGAAPAGVRCGQGGSDTVRAAAVAVACGGTAAAVVVRGGPPAVAEPGEGGAGGATLNGAPLGRGASALCPGDVLALGGRTVVVDSLPGGALAFARSRNGALERMAAVGVPALVPTLDTVLARTLATSRVGAAASVALTLDVTLGRAIQARLAERCAAMNAAGGAGPVRRCSAMLVDPERGDVLALASWERPGVRVAPYDAVDPNFRAHRPGSVVKPIFAAAVLARYPELAELVVAHPADTFSTAAGWPLGWRAMRARRNGCADRTIGWGCFLPNSNNRFTVALGLYGLAEEGAEGSPRPVAGEPAEGPPSWIGGRLVTRRPKLPADRPAGYLASPLARNLAELFDARVGRVPVGAFDTTLWRPARARELVRGGPTWQRVSPALPSLPIDGREFASLRHVAGFLIGESDNAWSNAALVRAMSRLMTGRAVELRLLGAVGADTLAPERPRPLPFGPGRAAVLEGMRGAVRPPGTAGEVAALFPSPALDLMGKTGTLESEALAPLSAFLFGGRQRGDGPRVCPAAGIVVVELESGVEERLKATALFADAVAPALRDHLGWGTRACDRRR